MIAPFSPFCRPKCIHTSDTLAKDMRSTQSIRSDGLFGCGSGVISSAPAPSESIQRRKSLPKASTGFFSRSVSFNRICGSKCEARREGEASSEPVTTAFSHEPASTLK